MKKIVFGILFLIKASTVLCVQEILVDSFYSEQKERGEMLSKKYYQGPYLMYDCEEKHWVCGDKKNFESCAQERMKARSEKLLNLPCAPIKNFESIESCINEQKKIINLSIANDFCYFIKK